MMNILIILSAEILIIKIALIVSTIGGFLGGGLIIMLLYLTVLDFRDPFVPELC